MIVLSIEIPKLSVCADGIVPGELEKQSETIIAFWMEQFICEARKKDTGDPYPPETLHALVVSLQRHIRIAGNHPQVDFFKQPLFNDVRQTLDAMMKKLTEEGLETEKKKAEIITEEVEDLLWNSALLGDSTPQVLLDTIVYCNGVYFAL